MNEPKNFAAECSSPPTCLPACPEWKTAYHIAKAREGANCAAMSVAEALPSSSARIGWLQDRNKQLNGLLDYAQAIGVPMGSSTWAQRIMLRLVRLEAESAAAHRVLADDREHKQVDINRLRADFAHARVMHAKHLPPQEMRCDWCGWPGARLIGGGNASCEDCLPSNKPAT